MKKQILYTAGTHGNFLRYIFECYEQKKILPLQMRENGNFHGMLEYKGDIEAYDICYERPKNKIKETYAIIYNGMKEFNYVVQAVHDRGSALQGHGIDIMQDNLLEYEKIYGVEVGISSAIKEQFDFNNGQPPRAVLRNYFLLSFYTYFNHMCWKTNEELKKSKYKKIQLQDILKYERIQKICKDIYGCTLDFKDIHNKFLEFNYPLQQYNKLNMLIKAVEDTEDWWISDLNVISEAFLIFYLEKKHYNIPFYVNDFFIRTNDITEYIKYFPDYLKIPNKLFQKHWKYYKK